MAGGRRRRWTFEQIVHLHELLASGRFGLWWIHDIVYRSPDPGRGFCSGGYEVTIYLGPGLQRIALSDYQSDEGMAALFQIREND